MTTRNRTVTSILGSICALLIAGFAANAKGASIVTFDLAHNNFNFYTNYRTVLTGAGHAVQDNTGTITAGSLAATDVLVLAITNTTLAYSGSEIGAIQGFVQGGGGLLLMTDIDSHSAQAVPIATAFGLSLPTDVGTTPTTIHPHPATAGVSALGLDLSARTVTSSSVGFQPLLSSPGGVFGAALDSDPLTGLGHLIYFGDVNTLADFNGQFLDPWDPSFDAAALALGTTHYLIPEPSSVMLLGLGAAALAGLRLRRR